MKIDVEDIKKLVYRAGEEVMALYDKKFTVFDKHDGTLVSEADYKANEVLIEGLSQQGWPILSEEVDDTSERLGSEYLWIIDPIDGTDGFVEKNGEFSIMVALTKDGVPVLGISYEPSSNKMYYAVKGEGAFLDDGETVKRMQVSICGCMVDASACTGRKHVTKKVNETIKNLGIQKTYLSGGVGVKIGRMLDGDCDLYFSFTHKMGQWDVCAPHILLEEAGGMATGIFGEKLVYNQESPKNLVGFLATNGVLHDGVLKKIKETA